MGRIAEEQFCFCLVHDVKFNIVAACIGEESHGHPQAVFFDKIRI